MIYEIIAKTFEKIEGTSKRLEMTDYLVELFNKCDENIIDKVVYMLQGKVLPDYESVELGLAEKLTLKAISTSTGISEAKLEELYRKLGDLGLVAEEAIKNRKQSTLFREKLTVEKVYENLLKIARETGEGSQDRKIKYLTQLLNNASPLEARYIVRTVQKKLRLGIADMTILDALAIVFGRGKSDREIVERAYNVRPDLGYIARVLKREGIEGVRRIGVSVGVPVRVMLAERLEDLNQIIVKMGGIAAFEYKYDGLRVQSHISNSKVSLYSRRLENITDQFPDVAKYVREAFKGTEGILDGEIVPVDLNTGDILPFQVVSHRRGRKYEIEEAIEDYPVVLYLFDIIYKDGRDLTLESYPKRREILEESIEETDRVRLAHRIVTGDLNEARKFFERAIAEGCEGIVAKSISEDSVYRAGAREFLWIKFKRDYQLELGDTVDLVVVGAFSGRGKRKGTYGALLMASYNPKKDVFETVCKLGSGFTDEDLQQLPKILDQYRIPHKHPRVYSDIEADVWFVPSLVLEVVGAEITLSPIHTCCRDRIERGSGLAIRFPRFTGRWRFDKAPEDSTTSEEIEELYKNQKKKVIAEDRVDEM